MRKFGFTFITLCMLASCTPQQAPRVLDTELSNNSAGEIIDGTKNPAGGNFQTIQWFAQSQFSQTLTINSDNKQNSYFRGDDVYNYLLDSANFTGQYCLVVNFTQTSSTAPNQLRVLVIPQKTINYATSESIYFFRVNLNSESGNNNCDVPFESLDTNTGNYINTTYGGVIAHKPSTVCTNCQNIITSTDVKLYRLDSSKLNSSVLVLTQIGKEKINTTPIILRINANNDTTTTVGSCTTSSCRALGYDCCFDGQCVNDAQVKPTVDQVSDDDFKAAELEKTLNPLWYKNYPQYYYACLESPPSSDDDLNGGLDPEDPISDAEERLEALKLDYACIMELDENTDTEPFQVDINTSYSAVKCELSDTTDNMYYQTVLKRLYANCGCAHTDYDDMLTKCPAYSYKPIYVKDNDGENTTEIQDIVCLSPEPEQDKQPFQDLDVVLNSKSSPHRYFNEDGEDLSYYVTNNKKIPDNMSTTQEGDTFQYLDTDKILPLNSAFSMNSVLGQMKFPLTEARPAKVVELEFDKMYYIATLSGYYTPCPECAKDSWFTNFAAYPVTTQGVGLQSVGYSTKRDEWASNNTYGNYEDTIFGRACWVPPTMIPWSHSPMDDAQDQRMNRLKTQAALFINGYQRDWYGFNKGAVIGSFDGVTWFAVGKGRIVKSNSTRLFLAINAPFADLAEPTDHIVTVQEYDFITTGAHYDFNPDVSLNSPYQNEGGTCQANHMCTTDAECISKLGWEYVCGSPYAIRSKWPKFDPITTMEVANETKETTIVYLLQQGELPGSSENSGRCIYRGAGAPCRQDYANQVEDEYKRKSLACAPNFYCAPLDSPNVFNREVARFAAPLENLIESNNHLFGQDANILGRPKDYIAVNGNLDSLPTEVINTLNENLVVQDDAIGTRTGICLPGKRLPSYNSAAVVSSGADDTDNWDPRQTHADNDANSRTDFISQIGACNSGLYTRLKHASCPVLDNDGNYLHLKTSVLTYTHDIITNDASFRNTLQALSSGQNACGMETLATTSSFTNSVRSVDPEDFREDSPYQFLEARSLASEDIISEPTFARDACFRKAGSVCHTDYDCFPNKKHSELIDVYGLEYFGNEAEMAFHQEYLVCGQAQAPPTVTASNYNDYDITKNRCCREVGQDLTMYTEYESEELAPPGEEFAANIEGDKFSAFFPSDADRYSRYSVISPIVDPDTRRPVPKTSTTPGFVTPSARITPDSSGIAPILQGEQWKTINDTAQRTCCGGGWIRKFADGGNNWAINRFDYDINNFKCLNYRTPLLNADETKYWGEQDSNLVRNERAQYCWDTTDQQGNCAIARVELAETLETIIAPELNRETGTMDAITEPNTAIPNWVDNNFSFSIPLSADALPITYLPWDGHPEDNDQFRHNIMIKVPTWVTFVDSDNDDDLDSEGSTDFHDIFQPDNTINHADPVNGVLVFLEDSGGNKVRCVKAEYPTPTGNPDDSFTSVLTDREIYYGSLALPAASRAICPFAPNGAQTNCCYEYNPANRVLKASFVSSDNPADSTDSDPDNNEGDYGGCNVFGPSVTGDCENATGARARARYLLLRFKAAGTLAWEQQHADTSLPLYSNLPEALEHRRSAKPGNSNYYLERFGRFELNGIPQITYLPVYCNDNYQKMVPGLFKENLNTVGRFNTLKEDWDNPPGGDDDHFPDNGISTYNQYGLEDPTACFAAQKKLASNPFATIDRECSPYDASKDSSTDVNFDIGEHPDADFMNRTVVVTGAALDPEPIFSENKFMCCLKLGQITTNGNLCCSGYASVNQSSNGNNDPNLYCKLPRGADLHVYFNRFVSGEGVDEDMPVDPLTDEDFNPKTGEPKMTTEVLQKITALGGVYCDSGTVRRGSALGNWEINIEGQQNSTIQGQTAYQFVDYSGDREVSGGSQPRNAGDFMSGFRWNHHLYCD